MRESECETYFLHVGGGGPNVAHIQVVKVGVCVGCDI